MIATMVSSKELLVRTGISRATLNNYIAQGILPKPVVVRPPEGSVPIETGLPRRVGFFPAEALDIVARVAALKRGGTTMAEISDLLRRSPRGAATPPEPANKPRPAAHLDRLVAPKPVLPPPLPAGVGEGLRLTLDAVEHPAYMVNNRFEVEWSNPAAESAVFGLPGGLPTDIAERSLFKIVLDGETAAGWDSWGEILDFHLAIAKNRMPKTTLLGLGPVLGARHLEALLAAYDQVEPAKRVALSHLEVNLAPPGQPPRWHNLYASFFREGIFFVYVPTDVSEQLMQFLSRRDVVIRELLRKRRPYLTPLAVLVADLQNSVQICAELPPEEYFELINHVWNAMEPVFRKYHATHGKHVGDGMLYYFFPQPDCNYVLNAVRCACEMREIMREISRTWRSRKNWMNELHLNVGLDEGQEWFGTYQTSTHIEFTVLGDTINRAARLSDFAREGSVWITKNLLGTLTQPDRKRIDFGIRRRDTSGAELLVPETFSRVSNLVDLENPKHYKFRDIAVLPVTEVLGIKAG